MPGTLGSTEDVAPSILLTSHAWHDRKAAKLSQTRSLHQKLSHYHHSHLWCHCLRLALTLSKPEEAGTSLWCRAASTDGASSHEVVQWLDWVQTLCSRIRNYLKHHTESPHKCSLSELLQTHRFTDSCSDRSLVVVVVIFLTYSSTVETRVELQRYVSASVQF